MASFLDDLPEVSMGGRRGRRDQSQKGPGIIYPRYVCRLCGGDCPVYSSEGRVRRHKCKVCGHTFQTFEQKVEG